ncbi:fumarate reductase (CoM/CoB) subunit TfrB [uncultured Methanobrevibacter sp.]|uniref:fumarate reductase (CoM/CoB) subunit TfrB n=1 Tax=uncultured Methanobrevibacter sp. TaxID=253161 RepID=UPI00260BA0FD
MITVYVKRFDREKDKEPHIESYEIEESPGMKILDALEEINKKYDADISFRSSCKAGQCGSCGVKVNGNGALACKSQIKDNRLIEPLDFPVIKDLVVDRSSADAKIKELQMNLNCNEETAHEKLNPEDIKDTKKVRSCIECYTCLSTCPVVKHFKEEFLGPYFLRYISKFDFDPRDGYDRIIEAIDSGMYDCTSCGKCGSICPKNINSFGDAIEKLRAMAYSRDLGPLDAHKVFKDNITKSGRSVSKPEEPFIEGIHKKWESEGKDNSKEKVALFTGCMVDYRAQNVGNALMDVLEANNIEIDIPEGQVCCGSPLLRTGQTDVVQDLVDRNKEVFKDYDTVITICAGCGATLKNDHPKFGSKLNVQDISEFLVDKLDASSMKELDTKVTWHDPCHLSRGQGIKDQPREIIGMIPGVEFEELALPCQCCGAGGGIKSGKPEIALELAKDKAGMIKDTGAEYVTTICPFCQINLQDGLNAIGLEDVKTLNLIQLLKMAYDE